MQCVQCEEDVDDKIEIITCKGCKKPAHIDCAKKPSRAGRPAKFNKLTWFCKICFKDNKTQGEQSSDASDNGEDENVKNILLRFEKKIDDLVDKTKEISDIKKSCEFLSNSYDVFLKKQEEQDAKINSLTHQVEFLTKDSKQKDGIINELQSRVNEVEQGRLALNVEISGVEQKPCENMMEIVKNIAGKLGIEETLNSVAEVYRANTVRRGMQGMPPSLIVRFTSLRPRVCWIQKDNNKILTVNDALKDGSTSKVYMNEQLTPYNKKLLWMTKQRARVKGYEFAWTKNGKIFARKDQLTGIVRIVCESDVERKIV